MKKILLFLVLPLFLLSGCSVAPELFAETVQGMVENGGITPSQGEAVVEAFNAAMSSKYWWEVPLTVLGSVVLSFMGVRSNLPLIGRGAPTQRVGLPASKVKS